MNPEIVTQNSLAFPQSEEEESALYEFQEAVQDIIQKPEPHYLLRWLRARDLKIEAAKEMLEQNLEWRKVHGSLENIGEWEPCPIVKEDMRYKFTGFDNEGRPVVWAPLGRYNCKKQIEKGLRDEMGKVLRKILEECVTRVEYERVNNGGVVTQVVGLFDMEELWFSKLTSVELIQSMITFFKELESYYPEIIHAVYVINAHWVFSYAFNIVKPIMSARTIGKVHVYGKDRKKWEPVLLDNIPSDSVPEEYGGTGKPVL